MRVVEKVLEYLPLKLPQERLPPRSAARLRRPNSVGETVGVAVRVEGIGVGQSAGIAEPFRY